MLVIWTRLGYPSPKARFFPGPRPWSNMARSRLHKRYSKNPGGKHNPPLFTDLLEYALPGFGGFAATRFVTRVAATQVAQRAPSWAKHAGAVASIGSFAAAWFLAHRWKWLARWHTPIVVGSAIAALQSLIQLYVPMLGWVVSDASPEIAATSAQNLSAQDHQLAQHQLQPTDEDPNEFMYNDLYDAGRHTGARGRASMKTGAAMPPPPATVTPGPAERQADDADDLAISDAVGEANLGVFANAN